MFSVLEYITNFIDLAWDTFVRNHFPNHTVQINFYGEKHLHTFVRTLQNRQDALPADHPAHERFEDFWREFDRYYRCMCRDFNKFMTDRTLELSYYNSLQTTGVYMVTIRSTRSRRILFRSSIYRLCSFSPQSKKENIDNQTTII